MSHPLIRRMADHFAVLLETLNPEEPVVIGGLLVLRRTAEG